MENEQVINAVRTVIQQFVKYPDEVQVTLQKRKKEDEYLFITVKVHITEIGFCIGRSAVNINALRVIVGLICLKHSGLRSVLRFYDPEQENNDRNTNRDNSRD